MNLSSASPFSPHNDVLSASPTTTSEKQTLIEELKRRGRVSVTTKRYPDGRDLYTKAIETLNTIEDIHSDMNDDDDDDDDDYVIVKEAKGSGSTKMRDLAILFSNRALCNLQMSQTKESYEDALCATCHDESYVKGYWRLGQASMALKKTEESIMAYEKALGLDGENKALKKELEKAKKQLELEKKQKEEEERLKEEERFKEEERLKNGEEKENVEKTTSASAKSSSTTTTSSTTTSSSTSSTTSTTSTTTTSSNNKISSSSSNKQEKKDTSSSNEFSKSDHVRGYKIINGKKTSFFHHEQTEEEKRLIGDITPKRIDPNQIQQQSGPTKIDDTSGPGTTNTTVGTSAWNKAGTWEEKDVTDWAIKSLQDKINDCEYDLPEGSPDPAAHVQVTKISKLISSKVAGGTCHASVATVRSKKRYIFEFTVCVDWEMILGDGRKCKGKMTFLDVDGTHEIGDGYDMTDYTVDSETPSDTKFLLERFVRDGGFRSVIERAMDDWIGLFREKF